jgi:predicted nucleic acid-binding Zn ribbon protein
MHHFVWELDCDLCGEITEVVTTTDLPPEHCPMCGADVEAVLIQDD